MAERPRAIRAVLPYLILLPLCALATVMQVREYRQWRAAYFRTRAQNQRILDEDHSTWQTLDAAYRQAAQRAGTAGPTRVQAEAAFNGGQPFKTMPTILGDEAAYVDPRTGGRALLHFRDGTWTGVAGYGGSFALTYPAPPENLAEVRHVAYRGGWVVCLLLLLTPWAAAPAMNRTRVHWFVATGIASTWLAFLGPRPAMAWNSFFRPESAGWGLFLFAPVAVLLLLMTYGPSRWRRRPTDYPTCPRCGYNLTGNRSGVCPECGTAIAPESPGPPTRPAATSN